MPDSGDLPKDKHQRHPWRETNDVHQETAGIFRHYSVFIRPKLQSLERLALKMGIYLTVLQIWENFPAELRNKEHTQ